jgi:hypothetical protein
MTRMDSARNFETCMARLYTDSEFRHLFLATPSQALQQYPMGETDRSALLQIDPVGLALAANSFQAERDSKLRQKKSRKPRSWVFRARRWVKAIF